MIEAVLSSFLLVALSEMGDKTQLLAFFLAARYRRPFVILAGIFFATLINHSFAAIVGQWVAFHFSKRMVSGILFFIFLGFGIWALKPDHYEAPKKKSKYGPFLTTIFLFFLAEMGDKTQLATVALAARFQSVLWVTFGTTLGMLVSDGLAIFLGEKLAGRVKNQNIRWIAAGGFFLFAVLAGITFFN